MKTSSISLGVLVLAVAQYWPSQALGESWKRTDSNAKTIAMKVNDLEAQIRATLDNENLDVVSKRDTIKEKILLAEIDLADALQTILYWAYQSPDQERYMKRVSLNVTASQLKAMKSILDEIRKHESWMTEEFAMDYIERESEKLARSEVLLLRDRFTSPTEKLVATAL